jgi:hypothetical protein
MSGSTRGNAPSTEQLRYARILGYGMAAGLIVLAGGFAVYVTGLLPAQIPFDALPRLWTLPVDEFLHASGMPSGWDWLALLAKGDVLAVVGIAVLAAVSLPCLLVLVPVYAGRRDTAYLAMALLLAGLLVLAASGVFGSH